MKMTLEITVSVEGRDAEAILENLLLLRKDPIEPVDTKVGTVGHEFLTNKEVQIDLEHHSREGGIAFRRIRYTCMHEMGDWLKDMSWNTFLLEIQKANGGKVRTIRNVGPVAIQALRDVLTPPRIQN